MLTYSFSAASEKGHAKSSNEDSVLHNDQYSIFGVADGLGKPHRRGEVASKIALEVIEEYISNEVSQASFEPLLVLKESFLAAHSIVSKAASENPEWLSMGTTLSCVFFYGEQVFCGHVGDSAVFLLRGDSIERLGRDQSVMVNGKRLLSQSIGFHENIDIEINQRTLHPKDLVLLCTDGISSFFNEDEIKQIVKRHEGSTHFLEEVNRDLINSSSFKKSLDDKTIVCIQIDSATP